MGGWVVETGDYKLATLCRGYWRAKLRTTIHPFFGSGIRFLASATFPRRSPFPPRSFLLNASDRLTTRISRGITDSDNLAYRERNKIKLIYFLCFFFRPHLCFVFVINSSDLVRLLRLIFII